MSNGNDKSLVKDPYKDISFSRRGLFAALAVVAGLGAVPARSAMAKELWFRGEHISPQPNSYYFGGCFTSGNYIHCVTHPDRTQGANDYGRGFAHGWITWVAADKWDGKGWNSPNLQALGCSLCLLIECDYSNELYDHIRAHPYMACADINRQNGRRLWHNIGTDDNHGIVYRNGSELSKFHGDMLDTDAGAGVSQNNGHWYIVGYDDYSYEKPELLLRRGPSEVVNTFSAKVDFNWVMRNNRDGQAPYEEDLRQVTGDIAIDTEKINIRNDVTLYGGVFKLSPLAFPNAMVDVGQGGYVSGKPITQWGNGRGLCFWKDYDGANQMWAFKPYLDDGVGAFTFALGSLIGPKLVQTLNNNGHVNANSSWKTVLWRRAVPSFGTFERQQVERIPGGLIMNRLPRTKPTIRAISSPRMLMASASTPSALLRTALPSACRAMLAQAFGVVRRTPSSNLSRHGAAAT